MRTPGDLLGPYAAHMRYVVLLRGINVGGINIKMADLKAAIEGAAFEGVRTVLASGNVLVDSDVPAAEVKDRFQTTLRERFGYDAWVLVYPQAMIAEIAEAYPYDASDDTKQPYVVFSEDGASAEELAAIADLDPELEQAELGPHGVLFWEVKKGETLHSKLGKASSKAKYKSTTTTRNLRTVLKLVA